MDIKKWKKEFTELLILPIVKVKNGLILGLMYANADGLLHRNSCIGPSLIIYYDNNRKFLELYHVNGKLHRPSEEGPADICYNENGTLDYEQYWIDGKIHRLDGPARINYSDNGKLTGKEYWIDGKKI